MPDLRRPARPTSRRVTAWAALGGLLAISSAGCVPPMTNPRADPTPNDDSTMPPADATPNDNSAEPPVASTPPSQRGGAPTVLLPAQQRIVLFGGMDPITDDTFEFDIATGAWRPRQPDLLGSVPARRCHHTFVAAHRGARGVLFGGFSRSGRFNDTWQLMGDEGMWVELDTTGDIPDRRCLHAAAVLPDTAEMVMYGGIHGAGVSASDFFEDTHVLNLSTGEWTKLAASGPGKRSGMIMFYSTTEDAVMLWGGKEVDSYPTDLWRFDPGTRAWSTTETTGDIPTGREDPTWFWDDQRSRLTIFSGRNESIAGRLFDDAHELDLETRRWRRIEPSSSPAPRWRASTVFDSETGRGWMFGGWRDFGGREAFNDTWWYDPESESWTPASPVSQ